MSTNGGDRDSLLEQVFSAVQLPPVNFTHQSARLSSESRSSQSEDDEQKAIRQLDDFLQLQNDSMESLVESEPSEEEIPLEDGTENDSSSTLKSPRSSRTNTEVHEKLEIYPANSNSHQDAEVRLKNEAYDSFDPDSLGKSRSFSEASHLRSRSLTFDSLASAAESRFGGFDLCDENGNNNSDEINLHHNEVAYLRPPELKPTKQHKSRPRVELRVDKQKLTEYQWKLAESKKKEKELNEEIHKTQSAVLSKEFLVRQVAQNAKKHLTDPEDRKKSKSTSDHRSTSLDFSSHKKKLPHQYSSHEGDKEHFPVDIYEEEVPVSFVLNNQLENAELFDVCSEFRYFVPQFKHIRLSNGVEKFIVGGDQKPTEDDKSVLLFGPVGSGKTALLNSMMNFLYDVKKEHDIRLCINYPDNNQPTKGINVYVFNNTIHPYSITIIDTPGVPNRKGYTGTSTVIKKWFDLELKMSGSLRIDAVSVVLQHDEGELGWPLINELAAVKRLLKDDLRTNVMPVTTKGEVLPQPQALRSLVYANIPFMSYYKINNVGYMELGPEEKALHQNISYKHAAYELERYFTDLHELVAPLLAVTHRT
ncbi:hypothetical protein FO519_000665 [Halicephalobus sp. NKZ332]|nr:hypothetical protein FO519_000665 [Halicephalobus sp. NKZ332]